MKTDGVSGGPTTQALLRDRSLRVRRCSAALLSRLLVKRPRLNRRPPVSETALLEPSYRLALSIFRDSVCAFAEGHCTLALTLKPRDKELDAFTTEFSEKLVVRATTDPESVPSYLDLIFISRALERTGDHATNIAEDAFWRDQSADIRHTHSGEKNRWNH